MSRISDSFAKLQSQHRRGFIPFITAGDPNLQTTKELIVELARVGSSVIELGVPFSDPMADGPVIQRSSERALRHGFGIAEILQLVADVRTRVETPIVLFSYFNPLLQFGVERLARECAKAGVDGVLVTDLAPEEARQFGGSLRAHDLDLIFLVAPTSTDDRLKLVAGSATGFIYAVSRAGVTGASEEISLEAEKLVRRVRKFSDLPVAVGFGISSVEQVRAVWRYADAAVVGSAIVNVIEQLQNSAEIVQEVGRFATALNTDI